MRNIPKDQRDQKREFTEDQKRALWLQSGKRCEWWPDLFHRCPATFPEQRHCHADHLLKPHAKGGLTVLENGAALCSDCNIRLKNDDIPSAAKVFLIRRERRKLRSSRRLSMTERVAFIGFIVSAALVVIAFI